LCPPRGSSLLPVKAWGRSPSLFQEGDETVIYTAYITLKNGKRLYAWQYGLKAFRLKIRK
jgi:hypothetical protein